MTDSKSPTDVDHVQINKLTAHQDAIEIAIKLGSAMWETDVVANVLGMKLDAIKPGYAQITMPIRADMLNSHGFCHGGMTFTLADTAFAYACNSRNEKTVALACNITFAKAVVEGDTLTAVAEEEVLNGRTGLYTVTVSDERGIKVAFFRGNSYKTSEAVVSKLPLAERKR